MANSIFKTFSHRAARAAFFAVAVLFVASGIGLSQQPTPFSVNNSPLPPPTGFVNDYAGVIDQGTKQQLETKLKAFRDSTNPPVEIAVAVVKTTGDRDIFDYSLAVARGWQIGAKEDDNPGALLFVAIDDRKYFTQVSRNLEDELPDGAVGGLQRQYLVPEFKKGNYAKGISDTVDAYITTFQNKGVATATPQAPISGSRNIGGGGSGLFCCAIILLVVLLILFTRSKGGRGGRGGGVGGGGFGSALPWIVGGLINAASSSSSSSSDWGGSSGDWGGSSGGGFGGFGGGGDFGGGGSGGSW